MGIIIKFVLKNIWEKKLRTLLILISVMLSSALFFATEALSDTAKDLFIERMKVYYGTADLLIYATHNSPSNFFYKHQAERFANDLEYIVGSIETGGNLIVNQETLRLGVKGFTLPELQKMNPFFLVAQRKLYPFQGNKIILSKRTAEEYDLKLGDYLEIEVFGAKRKFLITALAEPVGPFQYDGQNINAVVPLDTLATILNARGKVATLYLKVRDPARKGELIQKLSEAYPRYQVRETITGREMEEYSKSLTTSFQMMGTVVLFMAVYIIYTSFKVITRERLPVIGTFRSIGATRKMTSLVLMIESIMYGVIGGLLGCGLGIGVLYLIMLQILPEFLRNVTPTLRYSPPQLGAAFVLAILIAFISSLVPILKASRIPVKEIILNSNSKPKEKKRWQIITGMVLIGAAASLPPFVPFRLFLPTSMILIFASIIGFILLIPTLTNLFLTVFARVYLYLFGNEGILAAKNLRDNKGILNNISLLAIGISSLLMINTISISVAQEVTNFYRDGKFQIWLWTWQADRGTEALLRKIDGVEATYGIYTANYVEITNLKDRINLVHGVNQYKYLDYWAINVDPTLLAELDTGRKILISNTLRERWQVQKGDFLVLKMTRGERKYQIIGFFDSLMWNGSFALMADRYLKLDMNRQYYDDLFIKTNKDPAIVSTTIKEQLKRRSPYVSTMAELEAENIQANASMFRVMRGFSLLALVIGTFGVFNNLIISFLERQRSLALLRSIGMSKNQSIKMFFIEALTGGLIGGIIGVLSGSLLISISPLIMKAVAADIPLHHSLSLYLSSILAGVLITVTASTSPAFKSSNLDIVTALKYE
ncbi:MAG: FtsX-like permease family protein [Firmicutes bacterium]|nr:FtsX-like permease family protein [Bacillota bacterium]